MLTKTGCKKPMICSKKICMMIFKNVYHIYDVKSGNKSNRNCWDFGRVSFSPSQQCGYLRFYLIFTDPFTTFFCLPWTKIIGFVSQLQDMPWHWADELLWKRIISLSSLPIDMWRTYALSLWYHYCKPFS